jgi:hypothetical protein
MHLLRQVPPRLLLEGFAGRIARERRCHSTVALHAHIPSEEGAIGLLVATVQRRSLTTST